jgi:hypothetical protein
MYRPGAGEKRKPMVFGKTMLCGPLKLQRPLVAPDGDGTDKIEEVPVSP